MGERGGADVGIAPRPSRPLPQAPLVALALLLALLIGLAVAPTPSLDAEQASSLLLARSLAEDGDRLWQVPDRARAERLADDGLLAEGVVTQEEAYGDPFGGPLVYGLFLAPWAALAGARGALLAQGLFFAAAALFAARTLAQRAGRAAAWLPSLLLMATATGAYLLRLWPEAVLAALVMLAFALVRGAEPPAAPAFDGAIPDLYPEETVARPANFAPRWLVTGALLGAVASAAPWTLPLLWPAAEAVPASRRRQGVAMLLGMAALVMLALAVTAAATANAEPRLGSLAAGLGLESPPIPRARVLAWDLAYLAAGRHIGLVFYFAPLLLLAVLTGSGRARRALPAAVGLSVLLLLLLRPYDLAGGSLTIGLRSLVPLAAALCLGAVRPPSRLAWFVACGWSAAWLWPLALSPLHPFGAGGELRYAAPYLAPWAPLETTQPALRFGSPLRLGRGRIVLLGGEVLAGGRVASVPAGKWVEVLAGVPGGAPGFWVEGGEQSGNELPVRGAEVTETIFRPDGGISFLVRPEREVAKHEMPGESRPWSFYHLSIRLPGPEGKQFTIRLRPG